MGNPRIIVSHEKKLIIVNNYKAGFATFNNALNKNEAIPVENPNTLKEIQPLSNYRKVLFFREPHARFVSFLNDKVILGRGNSETLNKLIRFSGGDAILPELERVRRNEHPDRAGFIEEFIEYLSPVIHVDGHTVPQHMIYTRQGLDLDFFDAIHDYTFNTAFLKQEFGLDVPVRNQTGSKQLFDTLMTPKVKAFCSVWYAVDLAHFARL